MYHFLHLIVVLNSFFISFNFQIIHPTKLHQNTFSRLNSFLSNWKREFPISFIFYYISFLQKVQNQWKTIPHLHQPLCSSSWCLNEWTHHETCSCHRKVTCISIIFLCNWGFCRKNNLFHFLWDHAWVITWKGKHPF